MNLFSVFYMIICFVISGLFSYFRATGVTIDMMPPVDYTVWSRVIDMWFIPSILSSILFTVLLFLLNHFLIKKKLKWFVYGLFFLMFVVLNIVLFYFGVNIVY